MDFKVNGQEIGTDSSEIRLPRGANVHVEVNVAAYLDPIPNEAARVAAIRASQMALVANQKPFWDLERARIGATRDVPVELVVNGTARARKVVTADGAVHAVVFDVPIEKSSWIALRIAPSSHTNPIFAIVDGKPIRASLRSAEWCLAAVNQCWSQKVVAISNSERESARKAYDHAREVYSQLLSESSEP